LKNEPGIDLNLSLSKVQNDSTEFYGAAPVRAAEKSRSLLENAGNGNSAVVLLVTRS